MKKCPHCAEEVQDVAKKCKHCGEFLDVNDSEEKKYNTETAGNEIPLDILNNATLWRLRKIKDPKKYGGWSKKFIFFGTLIPIVGIIMSVFGLKSKNAIKNAQARTLLFNVMFFLGGLFMLFYLF